MPRVQDAIPSLDCRAWKGRSNPLLLSTLRFAPESRNLNSLAITVDGYTLTGGDLVALGALGIGDQNSPKDNQWVTITGLGAFTQVSFSSTRNAFEFSLGATGVPE